MRTTITIDDDLMADAATYSGIKDRSKLIQLALDSYVKRMAAKRLLALGGTMPDLELPDRQLSRHADDLSPAREAARSLSALGGTMPEVDQPKRRRNESRKVADGEAEYRTGDDA